MSKFDRQEREDEDRGATATKIKRQDVIESADKYSTVNKTIAVRQEEMKIKESQNRSRSPMERNEKVDFESNQGDNQELLMLKERQDQIYCSSKGSPRPLVEPDGRRN